MERRSADDGAVIGGNRRDSAADRTPDNTRPRRSLVNAKVGCTSVIVGPDGVLVTLRRRSGFNSRGMCDYCFRDVAKIQNSMRSARFSETVAVGRVRIDAEWILPRRVT